jgi:hypothetical protein
MITEELFKSDKFRNVLLDLYESGFSDSELKEIFSIDGADAAIAFAMISIKELVELEKNA